MGAANGDHRLPLDSGLATVELSAGPRVRRTAPTAEALGRFSPQPDPPMRVLSAILFVLLAPATALAQHSGAEHAAHHGPPSAEQREVLAVIERLFDGMRARDTATMRGTFAPGARLASTQTRDGVTTVSAIEIERWLAGVARATELLDERLVAPEVRVDDDLATVWVGYNFYVGTRFSHCGYDAFQLARVTDGWKIVHVMDTRRTDECPASGAP